MRRSDGELLTLSSFRPHAYNIGGICIAGALGFHRVVDVLSNEWVV